jgi:hypothetical protein
MSDAPAPPSEPASAPKWRAPLLLGVLCAIALTWAWVSSQAKDPKREASDCYELMFAGQTQQAMHAFERFRQVSDLPVPEDAEDEVFLLEGQPNYPIPHKTLNAYLMERIFFYSQVSRQALKHAGTQGAAAIAALEYVRENIQPGTRPESDGLVVTSMHVLYRGYGNSVEMAWVMAEILRFRGLHACLVLLKPKTEEAGDAYALVGVLIGRELYLFDPYRAVAVCRASDGRIADLKTLTSGADTLAPEFGGPERVESLKEAAYLVPSSPSFILPDSYRLANILRQHERRETLYRSFRADLRNIAAAVFGEGSRVRTAGSVRFSVEGRDENVLLWDIPFKIDQLIHQPEYFEKIAKAHTRVQQYWIARQAHLFGEPKIALELFQRHQEESPDDAGVIEDIAFFSALAAAKGEDAPAKKLAEYLAAYPDGQWRPLATLRLAEVELAGGNLDAAKDLLAELGPAYALRARLMQTKPEASPSLVTWQYPDKTTPPPAPSQPDTP